MSDPTFSAPRGRGNPEEGPRQLFHARFGSARSTILCGMAIVLLVFGGGGYWMASTPWQAASVTPGVVAVESKRQSVQHLEGGIVGSLNVTEGSVVREGDVLVQLDATRAESQLAILRAQLDLGLATKARLIAERDGAWRIAFPDALVKRRAELAATLDGQERTLATRRDMIAGETAILHRRIGQLRESAAGTKALLQANAQQSRSLRTEREGLRGLEKRGYVKRTRILALERDIARLEGERATQEAELTQIGLRIEETELAILQLERSHQQDVQTELADIRSRNFELMERIISGEDTLRRVDLRAPVSGTVVGVDVHGPGAVIEPARTLMEIVPEDAPLIVEARVPTMHIEAINEGSPATVRLVTVEQGRTPNLEGLVETVSADRIISARFGDHYRARIAIDPASLGRIDSAEFHAGMPAEVLIRSEERTPLDIALKPFVDGINRAPHLWEKTLDLLFPRSEAVHAANERADIPEGELPIRTGRDGAPP